LQNMQTYRLIVIGGKLLTLGFKELIHESLAFFVSADGVGKSALTIQLIQNR
jgi:hypothetical protein